MTNEDNTSQGELDLPDLAQPRSRRRKTRLGATPIAQSLPVARVIVEKVPPHLDQEFDYLVPASMDATAVPGVRVSVPFGRQTLDGYLVERVEKSEHEGKLAFLRRVIGRSVVPPTLIDLAHDVAEYYAGSVSDVLRLAVPPRHARSELDEIPVQPVAPAHWGSTTWDQYRAGPALLRRVQHGEAVRAVWTAPMGVADSDSSTVWPSWATALCELAGAALAGGRRVLMIVPDARDATYLAQALHHHGAKPWQPPAHAPVDSPSRDQAPTFTILTHDIGPGARYQRFQAASQGQVDVVVGTRAAAFVPLPQLGLMVVWHDGDGSHQELHSPYPHVRQVLALRSVREDAAFVVGGVGRSLVAQGWVDSGWAAEIVADRDVVRASSPRVQHLGDVELAAEPVGAGRLPSLVWREIAKESARGPVLVQVPRRGFVSGFVCASCGQLARCTACHGPLGVMGKQRDVQCRWCGGLVGGWQCRHCASLTWRAVGVGSDRTAEELGRAFPGVVVRVSGLASAEGVLSEVPDGPSIVVATPGAEPVVRGGYAVVVVLDAQVWAGFEGGDGPVEVFDRWAGAVALGRSTVRGGRAFIVGEGPGVATAALVRCDGGWLARREYEDRREVGLPPSVRMVAVTGDAVVVGAMVERIVKDSDAHVLGPVDVPGDFVDVPAALRESLSRVVRCLVRVPVGQGRDLARRVKAAKRVASARRELSVVQVVLDPAQLL